MDEIDSEDIYLSISVPILDDLVTSIVLTKDDIVSMKVLIGIKETN